MPTTRSAAKRLRSSAKRHLRNRVRKSICRTEEKKFLALVAGGDAAGAKAALGECFSAYDRAAKGGTIHKNKADRKKARLTAKLQALTPAGA
ncbi:MAG: 30S ribosomal protein S20 [Lentisphaeria bacterium]|jgi:small subunit ribosomal protein S20